MELRLLRYFLTVAKEQSFTKAAEQLHITQPTLSRQMAAFEEELGVTLFIRSGKKISLTEEGILLKRRAMEILKLEEKRLSFRLDQETTERTSSFFYHFSPPYFIRMVIRKGYAGMDGRLPVTGEPVALGIGEKEMAEAVLLGKETF